MVSVTGSSRQIEVPADKINIGFVLGNKVALGSVNANRENISNLASKIWQPPNCSIPDG